MHALLLAIAIFASLADPVFERIDTHALPNPGFNAVVQDRAGFIWIGTQGGLARYDGYEFVSYAPDPGNPLGLADAQIETMLADSDGIWIGTLSSGLTYFDERTETFRTWQPTTGGTSNPRSASVYALARTPDGRLLIGGDAGLESFAPRANRFAPVDLVPFGQAQPAVHSLFVDSRRTVWAGTSNGLYGRKADETAFHLYALGDAIDGRNRRVWSLYENRDGQILVGSDDALFVLDRDGRRTGAFFSAAPENTTLAVGAQESLMEPEPGTIWAGSSEGELSIVDLATKRVRRVASDANDPYGLPAGELRGLFRDRSGLIWIAKSNGGLLLFNPQSRGLYALRASSPELRMNGNGATALAAAPGDRLWAGSADGVLVRLSGNSPSRRVDVPNRSFVLTLAAGEDGTIWIGTTSGLCRFLPDAADAQCPAAPHQVGTSRVFAVNGDRNTLWIGTNEGLIAENRLNGTVEVYRRGRGTSALSNDYVLSLYRDRANRLWVGTAGGLDCLDTRTHRTLRFSHSAARKDTIPAGIVTALLEDRNGRLWIGTSGGGLSVADVAGDAIVNVRHVDRSDGLPDQNVDALAESVDGGIWVSTDRGLALVDPESLRARAFGPIDGVPDSGYWSGGVARSDSGTIFFGGIAGITAIARDARSPWTYAPPLVVTDVTAGGNRIPAWRVNLGEAVDLPAGHHDLSLDFAALDYSAPQSLRYAYRLEGYDRDWIEPNLSHRTATYTNLSPGRYTLRIRGTNRLGVWSERELAVAIVAAPAWYESLWFRVLLGIAAIAALFGVLQLRTAALRRRAEELEAIVRDRTRALEEASLSDPLTGLRNRRFVMQSLGYDAALAMRQHGDLLFFMIDIDHFKEINDTLGHDAGDQVLAQMRERLQQVFRESDYLVRWGGEEFLAVARGSTRDRAPEIANRICEAVRSQTFSLKGAGEVRKTASVGFAVFPFEPSVPEAFTWQHVIGFADRALYLAKESGRDTWRGIAAETKTNHATTEGFAVIAPPTA